MGLLNFIHSKIFDEKNSIQNEDKIKNSFIVFNLLAAISTITWIITIFMFNIHWIYTGIVLSLAILSYIVQIYKISTKKFRYIDTILFYVFIPQFLSSILSSFSEIFNNKILIIFINLLINILILMAIRKIRTAYKKSPFYMKYSNELINSIVAANSGAHIIGKDCTTKEPVAIPLNDRFVHTLIIGATGTGKTSQVLIPMINQDLQNENLGTIVIEPKGDLAEKAYQLALYYGRKALYFNPMLKNCPYFNPLFGNEDDVIENLATAFRMLDPDSSMFFQNQAENLIRKSLKVLKRLYGNDATLLDLNTLLWNTDNEGRKILIEFNKKVKDITMKNENDELYHWFMSDYFTGSTGDKNGTKTYEHTSGIRTQVAKLCSNKYLRKVLNPPRGIGSDVNFVKALAQCEVICIGTAQGDLQALGSYLGYFLILQLQAAVFKRPGDEKTRKPCILTVDEFQVFANPGFSNMLTQGRSYRVCSNMATQNLALIGMNSGKQGKDFSELVKTNARNLIVFPGCNYQDADYFSKLFGEDIVQTERKSTNRSIYNPFIGWDLKPSSETTSYTEEKKLRFRPSEIIDMQFQEIICRLINRNSVMKAKKVKISFIDKTLNDSIDEKIMKFREENMIDTSNFSDYIQEEQLDNNQLAEEELNSENIEGELSKLEKVEFNRNILDEIEDDDF